MKKYEHIISLGFFCSVSLEIERMGLRDCSGPFDWVLSNLKCVLELINNNFDDFLCLNLMKQYSSNPDFYLNKKYNIHFYHDFDKYKKCEDQIEEIRTKYRRRIDRFYKNIKEPTLFIVYIKDQDECDYIESKLNDILVNLREFNIKNDILFISNDVIVNTNLKVFKVKADNNDIVARTFLEKNCILKGYLCSDIYDEEKRITNYKIYKRKKFKKILFGFSNRVTTKLKKRFLKVEIYDSLYYPFT